MTTWPPQEQLLFYHEEPLDVAADLAGRKPTTKRLPTERLPTEEEVKVYERERSEEIQQFIGLAADDGWFAKRTLP